MRVEGAHSSSVAAMSSTDELSTEQTTELREGLQRLLEELERTLAASACEAKPVDLDLSIGRLSRMDAMQQQHMALARRQRGEQQREQVRSALSRIERGEYGECLRCGEPIGFARLSVRPEALVCLACQRGTGEG